MRADKEVIARFIDEMIHTDTANWLTVRRLAAMYIKKYGKNFLAFVDPMESRGQLRANKKDALLLCHLALNQADSFDQIMQLIRRERFNLRPTRTSREITEAAKKRRRIYMRSYMRNKREEAAQAKRLEPQD